ncbi:MAG: hypothetical protein RL757_1355 [Bacteroidota bacterium]|jgi:gliding motility-associated lipoprotein GldD
MVLSSNFRFLFVASSLFLLSNCGDDTATPKPRAFPRVMYPAKEYAKTGDQFGAFSFEAPKYAQILRDSFKNPENKTVGDQIFSLNVPDLNARVYFTYYKISGSNTFPKLREDVFRLVHKHDVKANYVDEFPIQKPNRVSGFAFDIQGPAGCPFQFFLTDSTQHFLHGALYFNTQARPDSLAPIVDFMKTDIMQIINTFEWKK